MSDQLPPPPPTDQPWNQAGPYAYGTAPMPPMRAIKGLATAATVLFLIIALVDAAVAATRMSRANLIADIIDGRFVSNQDLLDADSAVQATSGLHLLTALALLVIVIIWQFRHAKNAETLGVRGGLGPGWAIGGWFVPLGNLVLPAVQMFQSSKGSDVEGRRLGRPKGAAIVIAWAIAFALGVVLLASSGALVSSDEEGNIIINSEEDARDAESSDRTAAYGYIVFVVAALLGIGLVRTLTEKQVDAYREVAATTGAAPAPPPPGSWAPPPSAAPPPPPPPDPNLPPPPT